MKNNKSALITALVAVVLAVVGFIGYFISETIPGYTMGVGLPIAVVVLALYVVYALCNLIFGSDNVITAVVGLVAIVLTIYLMGTVINGRVNNIAGVFSYDASNPVAWKAVYSAVVAIAGELLSAIVMVVSGFMGSKK